MIPSPGKMTWYMIHPQAPDPLLRATSTPLCTEEFRVGPPPAAASVCGGPKEPKKNGREVPYSPFMPNARDAPRPIPNGRLIRLDTLSSTRFAVDRFLLRQRRSYSHYGEALCIMQGTSEHLGPAPPSGISFERDSLSYRPKLNCEPGNIFAARARSILSHECWVSLFDE